ncbi:hypothetical protein GCM10027294_27150 [Marinactinospora endophytica]
MADADRTEGIVVPRAPRAGGAWPCREMGGTCRPPFTRDRMSLVVAVDGGRQPTGWGWDMRSPAGAGWGGRGRWTG